MNSCCIVKRIWMLSLTLLTISVLLLSCEKQKKLYAPQTFDDLKGHTVCVLEGSFQQGYAMEKLAGHGCNIVFFPSATDCMLALNNGQADVIFGAEMYAFNEAFRRHHLMVCHVISDLSVPVAFGVRKGNDELVDDMNSFGDSLIECGKMREIIGRWFNRDNTDFHRCIVIPPLKASSNINTSSSSESQKVLKVGIAGATPPSEILIDNKWTGSEIELLQRYAMARGQQLQISTFDFNNLIPALQSGKVDVIAAALAINEERQHKISFTKPYTNLYAAFIVPSPPPKIEGWGEKIKESAYYSLIAENRWMMLVEGLWTTIVIFLFSLLAGGVLGGGICWLRMNRRKSLRMIGKLYVSIMRNMPMLVFLMLMFYVFLAGTELSPVTVAIIAFGMNSAAYICEIYRTGIESVDSGQSEAGFALGFSPLQTFFYIVAPQAIHKALPVCKNEVVTLLKSTSVVGFISIIDLTKASDLIRSSSFEAFFPLLLVTIAYFILAWLFTTAVDLLVKRI